MPLLLLQSYGGQTYEVLIDFNRGKFPMATLIQGSDGNFYGTTLGAADKDQTTPKGTVFKMTPTGVLTTFVEFGYVPYIGSPNGANPYAGVIKGSDGNFYGTTSAGGPSDKGTVFKVMPAGSLITLASFNDTNGNTPIGGVIQGSDGNFYGTTSSGGTNNNGTVFKLTPAGALTTLVNFDGAHGSSPVAALVRGSDGNFYGTTSGGGTNGQGTVFKMTPAGALTTLVNFDGGNGSLAQGRLTQGSDGNFYGMTTSGGQNNGGTVFKMTPAGALTTLVNFGDPVSSNGNAPEAELVEGSAGIFYGTTNAGGLHNGGTVFKMTAAGTLTTLVNFDGTNGAGPGAGLSPGNDGYFYGTTLAGGLHDGGTAFKITPAGALTTLANFGFAAADASGMVEASDGNFYGMNGTQFQKKTPGGVVTTLANAASTDESYASDGSYIPMPMAAGNDGNFYGTTATGGTKNYGTVYRLTPAGVQTTLVNFDGTNGANPLGLLTGSDGNIYGMTRYSTTGHGTIFQMTPAGALTTLSTFNQTDGQTPIGQLIEGSAGNFYGMTQVGGASSRGTIFKMTSAGALTTLATFDGSNGIYPSAGLLKGSNGDFYGTTLNTAFKITPLGALTQLAQFTIPLGNPVNGLVKGSDGNFYGTTILGGPGTDLDYNLGEGTVFRLTPAGALTILVDFGHVPGSQANGTLFFGSDGKLYGLARSLFRVKFGSSEPTLTAPAPGTMTNGSLSVAFTLPEKALPGSVKLTFGAVNGPTELTLAGSQETSGPHSFTFDASNPTASPEIAAGSPISPYLFYFSYTVTLSYRDMAGNLGAMPCANNVVIDRDPPIIDQLPDLVAFTSDPNGSIVNYDPPQTLDYGVLYGEVVSLSYSQASVTLFPVGTTKVTVTAEDSVHNQSTMSFKVQVHGPFPEQTIVLAKGDPAPGRATVPGTIGVPPEDAVVASFGVPAIDDAGNLVFAAKWTSAKKGTGSGLFTETACLGMVGNAVPNFAGSTLKSFGDPVISGGNVACLAAIKGTVNGAAVLAGPVAGPLAVITHIGSEAPGVGAPFKSLKAIEMSGDHLALLATAGKVTGLWVKDGAGSLTLALLQGQTIGSKTIQKLVSFMPGNGSPGCGRGWLQDIPGQQDTAQVLALCMFTDKAQAVVAVNSADLANPVVLSQSGPTGAGGPVAGGSFASYGLPALNAASQSAFLASLPLGGTVTKANQRGVYAQFDGSGKYTLLAQTGSPAGATGGNFSLLKDPVLAPDGGVAFPAAIKGKTVKGAAVQTLWWMPPGGTLGLLAQGGAEAADLPGAKWKAFSSLAVAPACPLFAATLAPNKTNVTKASANGVWAMDATSHLRLLFRTGTTIGGKQVKSFTLLNALVGSTGVTRSFNATPRVVWLATFTDKTQAIVTTDLP